jgi:hypothetical protein
MDFWCNFGVCEPDFAAGFWPNFWSDFLVGIVIAGIIAWAIRATKFARADIGMVITELADRSILDFFLRNSGNLNFESGQVWWHIVFDDSESPVNSLPNVHDPDRTEVRESLDGRSMVSYTSLTKRPVFPKRSLNIFTITVRKPISGRYEAFYFLSTAYGVYPIRAWPTRLWQRFLVALTWRKQTDLATYGRIEDITKRANTEPDLTRT